METTGTQRGRRVNRTASIQLASNGPGLTYRSLHSRLLGGKMDPFLGIDDFNMREPVFPPHPHAGLSAVTYMFEDSPGTFLNRDSQGDRSFIRPGDLHWTEAAGGIVHDEVPTELGLDCHGAQIFVNMPLAEKETPARVYHLVSEQIPEVLMAQGARIRVLVGALADKQSPLVPRTRLMLLDVHLPAHASVEVPIPADWNSFAFIIRGAGQLGPEDASHALRQGDAVSFANDGEHVNARAGESGLNFLLGSGPPLHAPLIQHGPFVAASQAQLLRYVQDYQAGRMGGLDPVDLNAFPIPDAPVVRRVALPLSSTPVSHPSTQPLRR